MAEFAYINTKNASTGCTLFELNYGYYRRVFYKEDNDSRSKLKSMDKLLAELRELMIVYQENFYYAQKLQRKTHNTRVNSQNDVPGNKI